MRLEWSRDALDDLERFADFLHARDPALAKSIACSIIEKTTVLQDHPRLGRPIEGRDEYRQLVLSVRNARYVFQYFFDGQRLIMLRVFHGRELRD